ncbi:hypothetical protein P3377_24610, partial [Vibrio parahaemolyticus]|nr:hypothetical protein [Vibrio parahaemolyticus]
HELQLAETWLMISRKLNYWQHFQSISETLHQYSFISVTAYPLEGRWSLSQLTLGERQGTPWTGHQTITGLTHRDRQPFTLTFTPTDNLESPINLHVFGLWEEAGVPGENPR